LQKAGSFTDPAVVEYHALSVQPVTADEWKMVCKMGGV
jgi:predicted RNA-binding protein with PUA-like domain